MYHYPDKFNILIFFTRVENLNSEDNNARWIPVAPGSTVPFTFEERGDLHLFEDSSVCCLNVCKESNFLIQFLYTFRENAPPKYS